MLVWGLLAVATNLVTGNGFGFAVVSPDSATITKFYPHPYSFVQPDPKNPLGEGIETANLITAIHFPCQASVAYEHDSHVIGVRCGATTGAVFMPFGFPHPALIISWPGKLTVDARALVIRVPGGYALIADGGDSAAFTRWRAGRTARQLATDEIAELDRWRVSAPPNLSEPERHLWCQSEVMLRMAQSREANHGNGLIVASLPDGVWFTPWVRDMTWAAVALTRMGHQAEARAALLGFFNARPTGKMRAEVKNADYQVSVVRYFGDGSEEPFFTMEGSTNIEFDDWGEVLWLLGEYMKKYHDTALLSEPTYRGSLYQSALDFVVAPLIANLVPYQDGLIVDEDTSICEEHQKDKKHFAFSTAMAIVGLKHFADAVGDTMILNTVARLKKGFAAAFIRDGTLHGTLEPGEKNDIDGALLAIIHFGVVTDPAVIRSTVERMALLKVASGGYERVRSNYTDPAIFEYWYERQEFLFVDLSLAEVDRQLGRNADAAAMIERIVDKAATDHDIIPEMYVALPCKLFPGAIGDPTGARPMVGYGAGAYILDVLDR